MVPGKRVSFMVNGPSRNASLNIVASGSIQTVDGAVSDRQIMKRMGFYKPISAINGVLLAERHHT